MKLEEIDKLVPGTTYRITVLEDNPNKPSITEETTYDAEYRGPDREEFYLLFWIKNNTCATPFYYKDIISVKALS